MYGCMKVRFECVIRTRHDLVCGLLNLSAGPKMKAALPLLVYLVALLVASQIPSGLSLPSTYTVPAFLWSPHYHRYVLPSLTMCYIKSS